MDALEYRRLIQPRAEVTRAGQFWESSALAGSVTSLESFLSKIATAYGVPFTPTGSAVRSVRQFRDALAGKKTAAAAGVAAGNATISQASAAIKKNYDATIAAATAAAKYSAAAAVADVQTKAKADYDAAVTLAKARAAAAFNLTANAAEKTARADLARGVAPATVQTRYAATIATAKTKAVNDATAAARAAATKAQTAVTQGIAKAQTDAGKRLQAAGVEALAAAKYDQVIATFIAQHLNDPALIVSEMAKNKLTDDDVMRATGYSRADVEAKLAPARSAPKPAAPVKPSDAEIATFVHAFIEDPARVAQRMRETGTTVADVARATGNTIAAVTEYLAGPAPIAPAPVVVYVAPPAQVSRPSDQEIRDFAAMVGYDAGRILQRMDETGTTVADVARALNKDIAVTRDYLGL